MNQSLVQLTLAAIKEYLREPGAIFWSFGFPILMAIGLGVAFSGNQEIVHGVALVPGDQLNDTLVKTRLLNNSEISDTIIEKEFEKKHGKTKYVFHITSWEKAEVMMKRGRISAILTEKNNNIQYHYDPLSPEGELIQMQLSNYFASGSLGRNTENIQPIETKGLRYIDFLIPGLLGLGIMMSIMWGVCYSLIEKRSKKLLRRMVATPMKKSHYLLSQITSRVIVTFLETIILLVFAHYFFGIIVQGSLLALFIVFVAGNFCFFGLSILISSKTANTQVGNGLISFVTTPMLVLSGIFFSYQNFPDWAVSIIKFLPLTILTDDLRSIINEGAGVLNIIDGFAILSVLGMISFLTGLRMYRWY
jgi:ABC-type multidrug transport system permease subunit